MRVVLWDTRKRDVAKDFAGGFGVGHFRHATDLRGRIISRFYKRDYRPANLHFAYLAAILRRLNHTVEYALDDTPAGADLYIFNPALVTLDLERRAMSEIREQNPHAKIFAIGAVAYALPEAFDGLGVTIVRGEPEQLLWKLDDALNADSPTVDVGSVRDLDSLPFPDWSPFSYSKFKVAYDFWKFPTAYIQQSRGCTFTCNYCPYIMVENKTRFRSPESVVAEIDHGVRRYGFRSFKFRDPLFGLDRRRVMRLAELIGRMKDRIQFSIEGRIDLLKPETLRALKKVGLTSVTVGIETPDEETLRRHKRAPVKDDKQREFVALCRGLGIRTVAGFMVGFPHDTPRSIHAVLRYAKQVNPTYANFNVVTPYPGTPFFAEVKEQIASHDFSRYDVYTPVMKYEHMTADQVAELHSRCFGSFYFRWRYLQANASLLWPVLRFFGLGPRDNGKIAADPPHRDMPAPHERLTVVERPRADATTD